MHRSQQIAGLFQRNAVAIGLHFPFENTSITFGGTTLGAKDMAGRNVFVRSEARRTGVGIFLDGEMIHDAYGTNQCGAIAAMTADHSGEALRNLLFSAK